MEKWKEEMGLRKSEQEAIAAAAAKLEFQGSQGSHQEQCTPAGDNTDNGSQFWGKYDELVSDLAEADANNWDQLGPSSSSFEVPRSSGMMRAGEGSGMEYSMLCSTSSGGVCDSGGEEFQCRKRQQRRQKRQRR